MPFDKKIFAMEVQGVVETGERVRTDSCNYEIQMRRGQKRRLHQLLNAWPMDFAVVARRAW